MPPTINECNPACSSTSISSIILFQPMTDNFNYEKPTPLEEDIVARFQCKNLADTRIIIGDQKFKCHYYLLICYSKYLAELPQSKEYTLPAEQVTPKGFALAYQWMLNDESYLGRDGIADVLNAAYFLDIGELRNVVWHYLESHEYYIEFEAFVLFVEAKAFSKLSYVQDLMLKRITTFFYNAVASREFRELSAKHVAIFLGSDSIAVNTELEVLCAAILWFDHDWPARKQHLAKVLDIVRFTLLPVSVLAAVQNLPACMPVNRVIRTEVFNKYLAKVIYRDVKQPLPRLFVYDVNCPYHVPKPSDAMQNVKITYQDFIKYLRYLQTSTQDTWTLLQAVAVVNG